MDVGDVDGMEGASGEADVVAGIFKGGEADDGVRGRALGTFAAEPGGIPASGKAGALPLLRVMRVEEGGGTFLVVFFLEPTVFQALDDLGAGDGEEATEGGSEEAV